MNTISEAIAIVLSGSKKPLPMAPAMCEKTARRMFQDWARLAMHHEETGALDKARHALEQAAAVLDFLDELKMRNN